MKRMRPSILWLSLLMVAHLYVNAQHKMTAATGEFKNSTASGFISELETQTGYHFYYDSTGFDSVRVDMVVKNRPLNEVLDMAFAGTDYRYAIYHKAVFITKGAAIVTTLPRDFFAHKDEDTVALAEGNLLADPEEDHKPQTTSLENKLYEIGIKTKGNLQGTAKLAGYVRDITTGEPVQGAVIFVEKLKISVNSDQFGYYSITLPKGRHQINIQSLGKRDTWRQVMLYADGNLHVYTRDPALSLESVVLSAKKAANINSLQMGVEKVDIRTIKQIPVAFGEAVY